MILVCLVELSISLTLPVNCQMLSNGTSSRDLSQNFTCTHLTAWPPLPSRERFSKDLSLDITGLGNQVDQFLEWEVCESLELINLDI